MWIHSCRYPGCCAPNTEPRSTGGLIARRKRLTIDLHCHILNPEVESIVAASPEKAMEVSAMFRAMGEASVAHNNAVMLPKALPKLTRIEERLADMDAMGVDVQVMSPSPNQYYYWANEELASKIVSILNESIAALCDRHPSRLAGLGTIALQHPHLATAQLEHAMKLGLKGVEISSSVNGMELSHPSLRSFWSQAENLGALVFIHPFGTSLGERTRTHYLSNTIGQPLETTIALSHLIFGGVLDAHPGLNIVAAHGGGYLPTYIGRSDHAFGVRPEAAMDLAIRPSEHLRRIWFDTVVYDATALRHLIDRVGTSQIVVGTDYPYDMGHYDVHGLIDNTDGLSDAERDAILGGNAARLIGWPAA